MRGLLLVLLVGCAAPAAAPRRAEPWCFVDQARREHCARSEDECERQRKAVDIMLLACQER